MYTRKEFHKENVTLKSVEYQNQLRLLRNFCVNAFIEIIKS